MDLAITMGVDISRSSNRGTTTTIPCRVEFIHLDVTTALAALVATIAEVVVTENALVSFVALPGIKPSTALRRAKHQCLSFKEICCFKNPCHVYEWSSSHDV